MPSEHLCEPGFDLEPSLELAAWARLMFIEEGAVFCNPDHAHLQKCDLVAIFTNVPFEDGLLPVAGMAEIINVNGKPWPRAARVDYLCKMFGNIPQACVWVYAPYWAECDDDSACALMEHELYHFAHKRNKQKELMYDEENNDRPVLTTRAHDVGEFIGVVRRYGVGAVHPNVQLLVEAAQSVPTIGRARVEAACACGERV